MLSNLLFIITGLIGLITTFLIFTNYKSNRIMNLYIILFILIISLRFFLSGLTNFIFDSNFRTTYFKYSNFSLVVIPICYLYFKNLSENYRKLNSKDLLHFIFPVALFLAMIYREHFDFDSKQIEIILYGLFFIFAITYIILCFQMLRTTIWIRKGDIKVIQQQNKLINNWTLFLFIGLILTIFRLFISISTEIYFGESIKGHSYQWISALIWLTILFKILRSPEILYGYNVLHQKINENKNNTLVLNDIWKKSTNIELNNEQHLVLKEKIDSNIIDYIKEIESISLKYELFRNSKLTISDLANSLKIPKSHLSYLFKYHSTISFSEYKKVIRIHDAINQIEQNYLKNNTLDSLSKKVGFTSYNPFFTSFKEIAGVSPLEYFKMNKVDFEQ
ncbi:HTH araC/xylS-type domain-containing protein [Flavobacterium sinopsychrotolerans]|uniref:Helix-turn-helix domain-containing protein n=2 Tax=Flavobacterium sinopsychrotolerans TaxID=604089 RepID=A0A1H8MV07_9FLAO|nr:Helix-turn-helix domain-containing protein [Flavobacterium sinopsychrotolerans]